MKLLITKSEKVIKIGDFVYQTHGNTLVDTNELTIAEIKNIAIKNNVEITAKKKADIVSELESQLAKTVTQVNEMTDEQKFDQIVVDGFAAEKSDNDIKAEMFKAGCDFGDINKLFNEAIKTHSLRLSVKDRNTKAAEFLEGYIPEDVESHLAKIAALEDHLAVSTTQAGAAMKAWAKVNEIELPKAPKAPKVPAGFRGHIKLVADFAIENKNATLDDLVKYASENVPVTKGGKDNSRGYAVQIWNSIIFAKQYAGEVVEDVEEDSTEEEMV